MSKYGFFDAHDTLLATVEGEASFGPINRGPGGGRTMAMKVDGVIVARAEDVDGLRWVVESARVTVVSLLALGRTTLGDNGRSFAASHIKAIFES
jgi:hypothetical protein